jgi:hypothetical protein
MRDEDALPIEPKAFGPLHSGMSFTSDLISKKLTTGDPQEPTLLKWLASLHPRVELIARIALAGQFMQCRTDRAFCARTEALFHTLDLTHGQRAMVLADANRLQRKMATYLIESVESEATGRSATTKIFAKPGGRGKC